MNSRDYCWEREGSRSDDIVLGVADTSLQYDDKNGLQDSFLRFDCFFRNEDGGSPYVSSLGLISLQ
jgi:hypothetical protein